MYLSISVAICEHVMGRNGHMWVGMGGCGRL